MNILFSVGIQYKRKVLFPINLIFRKRFRKTLKMTTMKILVAGDVEGNLPTLFKRVESVNAKAGPFEMLLCVGSFFGPGNLGWGDYKSGRCKVPLPVYILGPTHPSQLMAYPDLAGCELCENVIYLGRQVGGRLIININKQ